MRSLNWNNITASADGGDFVKIEPGGYVARIVDMVDNEQREYVELVWDIAEGEHAGHYSDDWGKAHPYAHHLFMSYKDTALGMLKGRLEAIQRSNNGFDPFAAWDAGRLDMFRGRLFGINLQEEEYLTRDNEKRTRMNVCQVVDAQRVRDGRVKVRPLKTLDGTNAPAPKSSSGGSGGQTSFASTAAENVDIPF